MGVQSAWDRGGRRKTLLAFVWGVCVCAPKCYVAKYTEHIIYYFNRF